MIFVGIDWAEEHHDICVLDANGKRLGYGRVAAGAEGIRRLHALIAEHSDEPHDVVVGIEVDRGLLVASLLASGYEVYGVNPFAANRYRERHAVSRAKSDAGDAKMLADLVRTDRHNHRTVAADTELAGAIKLLARGHQALIWARQRQVNQLRNALRDFYPAALAAFGGDLATTDAIAVLRIAPTPVLGKALSRAKIRSAIQRGGRQRNLDRKAEEIQQALRAEHLAAPAGVVVAYGAILSASVAVIAQLSEQIIALEAQLIASFDEHPDAMIVCSLPGLGHVLGARILGEFGDAPNRYVDPKARKNYAGTAPITRASGKRIAVLARVARNRRLAVTGHLWAFSALTHSDGARHYYDVHRGRGHTHNQSLRALANRLVGILHGCLEHRTLYSEAIAWPHQMAVAA